MRLPESAIKAAILHSGEEIREQALHYYSDVHSRDESVMPLVIDAVEKYGRNKAFSILRAAEYLAQSGAISRTLRVPLALCQRCQPKRQCGEYPIGIRGSLWTLIETLFHLCFTEVRRLGQGEKNHLLASCGANVVVHGHDLDASDLLDHRCHDWTGRFNQMNPNLLEQVPPLFGGK
jgi:hypothetical protein